MLLGKRLLSKELDKKAVGRLHRRQFIGLFMSFIPLITHGKSSASPIKHVEIHDPSLSSSTQFYLISGWVLAENDLEFFSKEELVNVKRLQ